MSYLIRPIVSSDEFFLWEMLYQAIYVPPGIEPPGRDILRRPEIERYLRGWGRTHDFGLVAVDATTSMRIGAAWWRLLTGGEKGYGHIDDETPELTVAVVPKRRQGVGTQLLGQLIDVAQHRCLSLSLSVSSANPGRAALPAAGIRNCRDLRNVACHEVGGACEVHSGRESRLSSRFSV